LLKAKEKIKIIQNEVESFYKNFELNSDFIELRNLVLVSRLIIESAILRKESRGLHYNIDFPNKIRSASSSVISKKEFKVA
jgi:L-aspartate oxidase